MLIWTTLKYRGRRFCRVEMCGCMAHIRGAEKWGVVRKVFKENMHGTYKKVRTASIKWEDGSVGKVVFEPQSVFDYRDRLEQTH